jgi:hypothetical protein
MHLDSYLTLLGTLLTLFGLLISLFSIHLGTWLGQLTSLSVKFSLNEGSSAEHAAARREVRYELAGIFNFVPYLLTAVILSFELGVFGFYCRFNGLFSAEVPVEFSWLFIAFFAAMGALTLLLLVWGTVKGLVLRSKLKTP